MLPPRRLPRALACVLFALASAACGAPPTGSAGSAGSPSRNDAGPSLNVQPVSCPEAGAFAPADAGLCVVHKAREFSRDIAPLFDGCAGELCHGFGGGRISIEIGVPSEECCNEILMIEPGHPERSYVLMKLLGQDLCSGGQMPLDKPSFTADDDEAIADWICQGADITH